VSDIIGKWIDLQDAVNQILDSSKATRMADRDAVGIRQILEKKEGLFRMKMMGKRVNYAARSVISPDPNLDTCEVGVPLYVAKRLTFPEYVNEHNASKLKELIINGPFAHPGANYIQEDEKKISLETLNEQQRVALSKTLLMNANKKTVFRHLQTGDVVLFNR
jgi:DNA-directed RNA polymerase I subunit RPA1